MEIFEILKESKKINQALMDSTYGATDKLIRTYEKMEVECNNFIASIRSCRNHIRQEKLAKARIDNIKIAEGSQNHTKSRLARMLPKKDVILTDILLTVISLKRHLRAFSDIIENTAGELRIYVDNIYKINLRAEMVSVKKSALDFSDYYIETQADILINSMKPLKRYFLRIQAQISQQKTTIGATLASKK
ncbi:hypothetical protein INT47_010691 [Mucor saturninus]|uniref:Uncharacterized protein n=1 Tax=Mucor saturninus TaxID=64648 RepID=A0A8H7QT24_9FUNG|nr:hypothetical protein INT47_010691 [Mucor saturninus]